LNNWPRSVTIREAGYQQQEISVIKITVFRPDGQQVYDNVAVNSVENGILNFSVDDRNNQSIRQSFVTNLPFMIEHDE